MSAIQPTNISPVIRNSLKSGVITEGAVSESDYPMDAMIEAINFHFDTIGDLTLRKGTTQIGQTVGSADIVGLYQFRDDLSLYNRLIMVTGTTLYYLSGATWTSKRTGLTSNQRARFATLLNMVFMVNGTDATAVWDGNAANSFVTTGNALNAPIGKYIENFRARMWIAGNATYPDRLYYSTLPAAISTPVVTWDTNVTTGQWIDISPSDGENITALHATKGALLVFKNNHLYRVYSILQTDPDPQFNVGTFSAESIVETKNGVYFHHPTGFYRYDGTVSEVSRPIIDIVNNISLANCSKVTGWLEPDGDHVCWSVGNVTYNGTLYRNLVVRYTISTQVWTHYSYPLMFVSATPYNDGAGLSVILGHTNGKTLIYNFGTTDDGSDIFYALQHPFDDVDGLQSTIKIIDSMYFIHNQMAGTNVNYRDQSDLTKKFTKKVGQLSGSDTGFNGINAKGRKLQFRLTGTSKGEPISYGGYEVLKGTTQLVQFNRAQ